VSKENNYNYIAVAIVICGIMILASVVMFPMLLNRSQSNSNSYPSYNNGYNAPTPTPVPQAKFRVYNNELSWGSRQELVAKHLLAKDDYRTVYYLYGSCSVTNYGDAGGFATIRLTQQGNGGTTITREQTLYLNIGETQVLYWNIDDIKYDNGTYRMEVV